MRDQAATTPASAYASVAEECINRRLQRSERPHLMHNGLFKDLNGIVRMYRHGGPRPRPKGDQINDPLFPETSSLLVPFELSKEEENAIVSFLKTL